MNKQQLTTLTNELISGESLTWEHSPTLPFGPDDLAPIVGFLVLSPDGQFELDITIWKDHYHYPATREQPAEEGWADQEYTFVRSPFLSDLLAKLSERGIVL